MKKITILLILLSTLFLGCSEDKNKKNETIQEKFQDDSSVSDEQIEEEMSPKENQLNNLPENLEDEDDIIEDDIKDINTKDDQEIEIQDEIKTFKEHQQN